VETPPQENGDSEKSQTDNVEVCSPRQSGADISKEDELEVSTTAMRDALEDDGTLKGSEQAQEEGMTDCQTADKGKDEEDADALHANVEVATSASFSGVEQGNLERTNS